MNFINAVCNFFKTFVIPVKTGIQHQHGNCWIPAFAGMTVVVFGEKLHIAFIMKFASRFESLLAETRANE